MGSDREEWTQEKRRGLCTIERGTGIHNRRNATAAGGPPPPPPPELQFNAAANSCYLGPGVGIGGGVGI